MDTNQSKMVQMDTNPNVPLPQVPLYLSTFILDFEWVRVINITMVMVTMIMRKKKK